MNPVWFSFFSRVISYLCKKQFEQVYTRLNSDLVESAHPQILLSNHTSWWDGFLFILIHRRLFPNRTLYTVVLKQTLTDTIWLRGLGTIGIDPKSQRSFSELVRSLKKIDESTGGKFSLVYFPQGSIWPSFKRPLNFKRGISVLAKAFSHARVVPVGIHIEPMTTKRSNAFISFGSPLPSSAALEEFEKAVEGEIDFILSELCTRQESVSSAWSHFW